MPDIEFAQKIIPLDENFNANLQTLLAEGWGLLPGMPGIAVYPVQRAKAVQQPLAAAAATATIHIDESKIKILRDGKLIDG